MDSLIQARLRGPQAFAAWVDTLPPPGSGAKETAAAPLFAQTNGGDVQPVENVDGQGDAAQEPDEVGLVEAALDRAEGANAEAETEENGPTPEPTEEPVPEPTPSPALGSNPEAATDEGPGTSVKIDASPRAGVYGPPSPQDLQVVTDEEPPAYDQQAYREQLDAREEAAWQVYKERTQENTLACTDAIFDLYSEPGLTQAEINLRTGELEAQRDAANSQAEDDLNAELQSIREERDTLRTGVDDVVDWFGRLWVSVADMLTDGLYSKTEGNEGLGPVEMLGMIFVKGMTGMYEATIGNASRLVGAYNEGVIHGTTWLCNKALGTNQNADTLTQNSILGIATNVAGEYGDFLHRQQNTYIEQKATPWQALTLGMTEQSARTVTEVVSGQQLAKSFMAGGGIMTARQYASAAEIARVLQSMPSALDAAGSDYDRLRGEGKDVLGSLYYMGFSLALEWGTEAEIVEKMLGMMQPSTWLAKAGVAKNAQTTGGRRVLEYIIENIAEEPFKEGGQELLSYIGGELGEAAIFGEQVELSGEEAIANFVGGFMQRVLLSVSSLPAYTKSNQMLREMANSNQPMNTAKMIELIKLAKADMENPMVQSFMQYDVKNAMEAEASMMLATNGGVDLSAMEGTIEKAEGVDIQIQAVQADVEAAARERHGATAEVQQITEQIVAGDGDMEALGRAVEDAGNRAAEAGRREAVSTGKLETLGTRAKKLWDQVSAHVETQMQQVGVKAQEIARQAMEELMAEYGSGDGGLELAGTGMTAPAGLLNETGTTQKIGAMPNNLMAKSGKLADAQDMPLAQTDGAQSVRADAGADAANAHTTFNDGGFNEGTSRGEGDGSQNFETAHEGQFTGQAQQNGNEGGNDTVEAGNLQQTEGANDDIIKAQPGDADFVGPVKPDEAAIGKDEAPGSDAKLVSDQDAAQDKSATDEGIRSVNGEEIVIGTYDDLKKKKGFKGQKHHLNQNAAFRKVIPYGKGICVNLVGNILTDLGSAHYKAHKSLEAFWDRYRFGC